MQAHECPNRGYHVAPWPRSNTELCPTCRKGYVRKSAWLSAER